MTRLLLGWASNFSLHSHLLTIKQRVLASDIARAKRFSGADAARRQPAKLVALLRAQRLN